MSDHDLEFMPDTYAAEVESLPLAAHLILIISAVFLITAIVWANLANITEVAHADGRVIPSSQIQIIQNLEGGILAEVLTRQGARVKKGQNLMRLDDTRFASSYDESQITVLALTAQLARLDAEIADKPFSIPPDFPTEHITLIENERLLYTARQSEFKSALDILEQQLTQHTQTLAELRAEGEKLKLNAGLAKQELALTQPLVQTGAVSQVELLRLQIAVNESIGRVRSNQLTVPRAESVVAETREKQVERRQQFYLKAQAEINEVKTRLARLAITNIALQDRVRRTTVKSPVDGIVKQIFLNTIGAVVQPGMDLLEIVPVNDTLLVEAKIRPEDIAFIHPGQSATVKLTAYDFAIYGGLDSVLELISADTITDERGEHFFQIHVRTKKNHLGTENNPLPIISGMIATVDIITGEKSVMDYLLKPLRRAQANALSER